MGRRKRKVMKPWCWYCDREFEDEKVLVYHQKSKHYRCQICRKKLFSAMGLSVHCMQVHKRTIASIPNALPHRTDLDIEIFGMNGIPQEDRDERERMLNEENNPKLKAANNNSNTSGTLPQSSAMRPNAKVPMTNGGPVVPFSSKFVPPPPPPSLSPPPPPPPPSFDMPPPPPPFDMPPQPTTTTNISPNIPQNIHQNIPQNITKKNLLDLSQYKKFNVCISASSMIVHPEFEISLEEYRLSQREYRMCSTLPINGGGDGVVFYGNANNINSNVRPPTVAYGYLRMSSGGNFAPLNSNNNQPQPPPPNNF